MAHRGSADVLAAAAAGDEVAFRQIIAAHHEDMRRVCLVICGDHAIADEATQAAWFIAWKKIGKAYDQDRLRPWLVSVAANEAKKLPTKRGRRAEFETAFVWEVVRPLGDDEDHGVVGLAANEDGVLWAEILADDAVASDEPRPTRDRHLARFDGRAWEVFSYVPAGAVLGPTIQAVDSDGVVWLTEAYAEHDWSAIAGDLDLQEYRFTSLPVSFDGERWGRYPQVLADWASDPQTDAERWDGGRHSHIGVDGIAVGPDGRVWLTVSVGDANGQRNGFYVITPEAVSGTE